ncbi:transcriptional regulator [Nitratireductor pacificus pht-3B]|uniref:Transcriptional regulator n=2 Tax=Nitratireductor TaxID=245876 RepID=K2MQS3_9HYPH|nr:transcriptional regulator [Nitratireductor pacificus pht-3B]
MPDGFLMSRRASRPAYRHAVEDFIAYKEARAGHFRQREAASLVVPLIISFGAPFNIALGRAPGPDERFETFVAGLFAGPVVIDSFGASACIQVNFTPQGARQFFGLPMHALTGEMVPLDAVLGASAGRLRQLLGEESDWLRRLDLVEALVYRRLDRHAVPTPAIRQAFRRLTVAEGAVRIADLADDLGWSRKHLAHRFREEIGLGPKTIARMMRFQRVLRLARTGAAQWADIAAQCAYADQAHLAREFAEFAGETPSEWKARLV